VFYTETTEMVGFSRRSPEALDFNKGPRKNREIGGFKLKHVPRCGLDLNPFNNKSALAGGVPGPRTHIQREHGRNPASTGEKR